jgi:hypothetical protein
MRRNENRKKTKTLIKEKDDQTLTSVTCSYKTRLSDI